jgi:hypothetical protein
MVHPNTWGKYIAYIKRLPAGTTDITEPSRQCTTTVLEQIMTQCNNDQVANLPFYKALESTIERIIDIIYKIYCITFCTDIVNEIFYQTSCVDTS